MVCSWSIRPPITTSLVAPDNPASNNASRRFAKPAFAIRQRLLAFSVRIFKSIAFDRADRGLGNGGRIGCDRNEVEENKNVVAAEGSDWMFAAD